MCEGIAAELAGISLGDKRLNQRSVKVMEALAANPEASINAASAGWGDTQAAYRFFDNAAVTPQQILQPHRQATVERLREQQAVLIVQDTTELDYTNHPPRDAGCLNRDTRFGLYHHVSLAITREQLPLGVVATENFDRTADSLGQSSQRDTLPIEDKESFRWLTGYRQACELAASCPDTQIVSVADREADIYDIYVAAANEPGPRAEYIIRSRVERSTQQRDPQAGGATYQKIRSVVGRSPLVSQRTIELTATPKRRARPATLELRALTVQVKPPHARSRLPAVTMNVVLAEEVNGPADGTQVSWLLLTSLPIDTTEQVLRIVDDYVARWTIEVYFRTLKTGCRVEEIQLETKHRQANCLAFYNIIAWRVLYLTYLNRTNPKLPCTAVFDNAEWKSVWCVVKKTRKLPQRPPTLNQFMKLLTELGGYNNRAKEAPAGPQAVWTGLRRMLDFAAAWNRFGPET